jgi:mRNA interferase HigB
MCEVRVIARSTLSEFLRNRVPANERRAVKIQLDSWYLEALRASWQNSAELKRQFSSASIVSAERVVFNIKGNEYRLVVAIDYADQFLLIKWIGTHREYDKIDVATVTFERRRYADSTDPH